MSTSIDLSFHLVVEAVNCPIGGWTALLLLFNVFGGLEVGVFHDLQAS